MTFQHAMLSQPAPNRIGENINVQDLFILFTETRSQRSGINLPWAVNCYLMTGGHSQTMQGMECHTEEGPMGRSLAGIGVDIVAMAVVRIAQIKDMGKFRNVLHDVRRNSEALNEMFRRNFAKDMNGEQPLNKDGGLWAWKVVEQLGWSNRYGEILERGDLISGAEVIKTARSCLYHVVRDGNIVRGSSGFDHVHAFDLLEAEEIDQVGIR